MGTCLSRRKLASFNRRHLKLYPPQMPLEDMKIISGIFFRSGDNYRSWQ
jgi:hypothetical protein